jgi:hypothetical protein
MCAKNADSRPGYRLVFTKWITLRNGRRLYASSYGLTAFAIWVKE